MGLRSLTVVVEEILEITQEVIISPFILHVSSYP